jgi:hypothetical protein
MRFALIVATAIVGITSPALAGDTATSTPPEDKVICKRIQETSTGSHFPSSKRMCMKRSEWKELADDTDRTLRKVADGRVSPDAQLSTMGGGPE